MHDMMGMNGVNSAAAVAAGFASNRNGSVGKKNTYKKLNKEANGGNSDAKKEEKKNNKKDKKKNKPIETAKAVPESDEISLYDEAQTLTTPKTRLTAMDNSYE
jgi:hypothetical protein